MIKFSFDIYLDVCFLEQFGKSTFKDICSDFVISFSFLEVWATQT